MSISRVRGERFPWHGRTVIPTVHPAAILRGGGESSRSFQLLREDFATVRRVLEEHEVAVKAAAEAGTPLSVAPEEQLELF